MTTLSFSSLWRSSESSVYKSASSSVGPSQSELLADLRSSLLEDVDDESTLTEQERKYIDDPDSFTYLRYLIANGFDVANARKEILQTIQWRRSYRPDLITLPDVYEHAKMGTIYPFGFTKAGNPIIMMKCKGVLLPEDVPHLLKYYVFIYERAIKSIAKGSGIYQVVLLIDMEFQSLENTPPLEIQREITTLLQKHYPERMLCAYFTYQPMIFSFFYNLIWPFLEERHKRKINILGWSNFDALLDVVDSDMLEKKYGGTSDYEFDVDRDLQD